MADETEFAPPSIDPADENSLSGAFRSILQKMMQTVDDCIPARVVAYDRTRNRATIQPVIMLGTTDGQKLSRATIPSVPVLNIGGGGFVLSFPIKPGDLGWLKATDRDISLFLQGLSEEWPNTKRMHSFNDGLFIPDALRQFTVTGEDANRVVLQSLDGTARVAIGADKIKITHPTIVEIVAPSTKVTGNLDVTGTITAPHMTANGIMLETHHHTDPQGGVTGGPVN